MEQPNGPRATAALLVSLVLLVGGFLLFGALLLKPPPVTGIDPSITYGLLAWFGGIMAGITLMLRYWFPANPRRRDDDDK